VLDHSKLVPAQEARYYLEGGKILKTLIKGRSRNGGIAPGDFLSTFNDLKKDLSTSK
jgi:hypothetical protein